MRELRLEVNLDVPDNVIATNEQIALMVKKAIPEYGIVATVQSVLVVKSNPCEYCRGKFISQVLTYCPECGRKVERS